MRLQEYQSKLIFAEHGIPIPHGATAATPQQARQAAQTFDGAAVIKAQVLTGGRGKAGGVRLARTPAEAEAEAKAILSAPLKGFVVRTLLVEEAIDIRQEIYLGIVVDRRLRQATIIASAEGGVEIEQIARERPEAILKTAIDPRRGLGDDQALALAEKMGLTGRLGDAFAQIAGQLHAVFQACDALLAEINPLAITAQGTLLALDGKIVLDDNALFRHPDLAKMRDADAETPVERKARQAGLSYVYLGGDIGCIVNGAGLAMAAMDVIKHFGGLPANFLDVGGGAAAERVATALRLVLDTPGIKAVLINIFGGITHCDEVARGVVAALQETGSRAPLVVRMAGTNEAQGHAILEKSGYHLIAAGTLAEAAQKAVAAAGGGLAR